MTEIIWLWSYFLFHFIKHPEHSSYINFPSAFQRDHCICQFKELAGPCLCLSEVADGAFAFIAGLLAHDGEAGLLHKFPASSPSLAAHFSVPWVRALGEDCSGGKGWGPWGLGVGFGYTGQVLPDWCEHLPRGNPNKTGNWTEWEKHWSGVWE